MPLPKTKSQLELENLWRFEGRDPAFWSEMLRVFCAHLEAASGVVLVAAEESEESDESGRWVPIALWPEAEETKHRLAGQREQLYALATEAVEAEEGLRIRELSPAIYGAALPLRIEDGDRTCVATFLRYGEEDFFRPTKRMEQLMADSPLIYGADPVAHLQEEMESRQPADSPLTTTVTLGLLLNEETRFLAAAMVLCNELAARFHSDRVSLGWLKGSYLRLKATNHSEKLNRKMEVSRLLEAAMEECLDQDDEIAWPGSETSSSIERDHEIYARKSGAPFLASIPIRDRTRPEGVITLERTEPFTEEELGELRLMADLCSRRLTDLHQSDRWFGARWASSLRRSFGRLVGFEHTWVKLSAIAALALLAFLALFPWPFRVKASFLLQPRQVYHLPAPFDGYIEDVTVRAGDEVEAGDVLVVMDTSELELNRAELNATIQRFVAEAQLARAEATPAEMHIAISKAEETKSSLKKVQYNLEMAEVKAPEDGVVLEGEVEERIGAPVTRGEALLKVSQLEGLFAELRLPEEEATRVEPGTLGNVAFESRPEEKFPVRVTQIEPLAVPEETGNMLIVRTEFLGPAPEWWRPGMSGVAKLDVGERSLLYLLTRKAIDYLRMRLWI